MNPTVSVIVPVYKVEPYIHRCMDSILNQTYQDFELILVDDGSPDNCGAICDEYAQKDSRIHVIHQKNGGLSAARNAGLDWMFANSDSQWVTFIDSDDWVHRDYLKALLELSQKEHGEIVACDMIQTSEYGEDREIEGQQVFSVKPERAYCTFYGYLMSAWRKIYRRELFADVRFPMGKIYEDCHVTQIPLFAADNVVITTAPMYYYYANPESITRRQWTEKRLQEVEAHEVRLAWLEADDRREAIHRELEECVNVLFIHADTLANMCLKEKKLRPQLKALCKKLRIYLQRARKDGLFAYDRELRWLYILAFANFPVWRFANFLQKLKWAATGKNSNA